MKCSLERSFQFTKWVISRQRGLRNITVMRSSSALERDVLEHVRAHSTVLTESAQKVAHAVLSSPHEVLEMSAENLARASQTSVGTVMRFCNSIGQSGFHSFKLALAASITTSPQSRSTSREVNHASAPERLMHTIAQQVTNTARSLDFEAITAVAERIVRATRILILSNGLSQPIAITLGYALNRQGFHVSYPMDHETQAVIAEQLTASDVCVVVSHSGVTPAVLDIARDAAAQDVTVLALTSYRSSPLARLAAHAMVAGAPEDAYRNAEAASRPVHLAVVNALLVAIHDAAATSSPSSTD